MVRFQIGTAILSIDSDKPEKHGIAVWTGEYTELAAWLPSRYGMFGHRVGDNPAPMDVVAALRTGGRVYRVLEGQEILDLPISPLPEGAVS